MKCPVCRAVYRATKSPTQSNFCHRCGADLAPLIQLHDLAIAHHRQAISLLMAGDIQAAAVANDRAISLFSRFAPFHAFAGQLSALQGKFDLAVCAWHRARQLDPHNTEASACLEIFGQLVVTFQGGLGE